MSIDVNAATVSESSPQATPDTAIRAQWGMPLRTSTFLSTVYLRKSAEIFLVLQMEVISLVGAGCLHHHYGV
jgi:hypothetical protein